MRRQAFHLGTGECTRFCIATYPRAAARGALLYVHPFAEEMNKCRRMAAISSAAFAEQGWLVLQPDLHGCGDSAGDFADATWDGWLDDISLAVAWLRVNAPGPMVLWSLRAGSVLVADWLSRQHASVPLMLWQPVINGRQYLSQFLRLKAAGDMLTEADARVGMNDARQDIIAGRPVEVAGYILSPALARGLEASALILPDAYGARVGVMEINAAGTASPGVAALTAGWSKAGVRVDTSVVAGAAFWQTIEIQTAPDLIEAGCAWLKGIVC